MPNEAHGVRGLEEDFRTDRMNRLFDRFSRLGQVELNAVARAHDRHVGGSQADRATVRVVLGAVHRVLDDLDRVDEALQADLPGRYQKKEGAFATIFMRRRSSPKSRSSRFVVRIT